jgi:DNA modification methylase
VTTYYQDEHLALHHGDALVIARGLTSGSADCIVTSPPFYGLRDYGVEGQYGLEVTPAEYVETLRALFSELRRVLANDGALWLNMGDSYSTGEGLRAAQHAQTNTTSVGGVTVRTPRGQTRSDGRDNAAHLRLGMPPAKNLLGIPWRVAFALQDDGWILRNSIIWNKSNAMPESVTDRLSNRHENLFMFSKSRRYRFDLDPIREPHTSGPGREGANCLRGQKAIRPVGPNSGAYSADGRNPGDVWTIATVPFPGAHFATFPPELPRRCILAGCKPGGTVLDPFNGSGTTGMVAGQLGRRYVGIDINAKYLDLSLRTRLAQTAFIDGGAA